MRKETGGEIEVRIKRNSFCFFVQRKKPFGGNKRESPKAFMSRREKTGMPETGPWGKGGLKRGANRERALGRNISGLRTARKRTFIRKGSVQLKMRISNSLL